MLLAVRKDSVSKWHKREMRTKRIKYPCPSCIGPKHFFVFGSSDGESSDDSLVDLVSTEIHSVAQMLFTLNWPIVKMSCVAERYIIF